VPTIHVYTRRKKVFGISLFAEELAASMFYCPEEALSRSFGNVVNHV
jgi:hypothetical protein